jgi:hypothetical protein
VLRKGEGTDFIFPLYAGDRMIFAKNIAKKIQSPGVGGKIQSVSRVIFDGSAPHGELAITGVGVWVGIERSGILTLGCAGQRKYRPFRHGLLFFY